MRNSEEKPEKKRVRDVGGLCPPHHWHLDGANYGVCARCGVDRDFQILIDNQKGADNRNYPFLYEQREERHELVAAPFSLRYGGGEWPLRVKEVKDEHRD